MKGFDLFHTYCHGCRQLSHCQPVTWKDERGKWQVLLLCDLCCGQRGRKVGV